MKLKSKIVFVIIHSCLLIFSQTNSKLSFNQYLENVSLNHPLLNRADNLITKSQYDYKAKRGDYDPLVAGNYDNKFFNGNNYYSVLTSEIKQPIFTSQYLKAGYEYGDGIFLNPESKTGSYGLPFLGMEASLLQGMLIDKRRAGVLKAKENINYTTAERNEITNNVLFEALISYTQWSFVEKQLAIFNYFIKLARDRNIGIMALASAGEKAAVDTVEASITYQSRVLELQSIKIDLQQKFASVNSFNWNTKSAPTLVINIPAADSLDYLYAKMKSIMLRELNNDTTNNPIIAQYIAKENILKIDKRLKAEMIKPKLDVKYNFLSSTNSSSSAQFNSNNYKWGASLSMPLFLRSSRNEFKSAKMDVTNIAMEISSKNNELSNKVNYIKQSLSIIIQQLENSTRMTTFTKTLLEAERLKFSNGESSLFLLNSRENRWLESEIKLTEYKLKFIESVLNLIYLKGNLNYKL